MVSVVGAGHKFSVSHGWVFRWGGALGGWEVGVEAGRGRRFSGVCGAAAT